MSTIIETKALRIKDAAPVYGICKTKLYAMLADGTLKSVKVGRARLILKSSLDALLAPAEAA